MFKWQKLNIVTNIIPDLSTLIFNVKDSMVCSGFWESISHSRNVKFLNSTCFTIFVVKKKLT